MPEKPEWREWLNAGAGVLVLIATTMILMMIAAMLQ